MIISASRRTDIPAFYSEWFFRRLNEGCVLIPNPRNPRRLGRVNLSPDNVDCIVFWSKNPRPMIDRWEQLDAMGYPFYVQFTLTPYGKDIERNLPSKEQLIRDFIQLSEKIGAQRLVWRYDPIFIDKDHPVSWHIEQFSRMCHELQSHTCRCIISFMDVYRNNRTRFHNMTQEEMRQVALGLSQVAKRYRLPLFTCAEEIDLSAYDIQHASCVDRGLIGQIAGCPIDAKKDAGQRASCGCIASVDIGAYDTCGNGCAYCYATFSQSRVLQRMATHDPAAPMLTGWPTGDETITDRTAPSQKISQLSLF